MFDDRISTLKGSHRPTWNPFRVRACTRKRRPRAALRLPWAIEFNRFAVEMNQHDRNKNSLISVYLFPRLEAAF